MSPEQPINESEASFMATAKGFTTFKCLVLNRREGGFINSAKRIVA
jgi:hypothetical protein